jgi:hypothetical protein
MRARDRRLSHLPLQFTRLTADVGLDTGAGQPAAP